MSDVEGVVEIMITLSFPKRETILMVESKN